jgi:bacillithiol synthase
MLSFTKQSISFSETNLLPALVQDYINGKCSWLTGYENHSAFDTVLTERSARKFNHRKLLVETLKKQQNDLTPLQARNLDRLLSDNTYTVTTGHQLNLFTGPLYFIYKIITTIKLAENLNVKYKDKHFVPIYWMASEDHDLEEVNHTYIYGKRIEWKTNQAGAVGRMLCTGIPEVIEELKPLLGESENARKIIAILKKSYRPDITISDATRIFVNELCGKYGLLILNADNKELKKIFHPVTDDDMKNHSAFRLVNKAIEELESKKYSVQVHPREINSFRLKDSSRERILKESEILTVQEADSYSPNVILRTLYQETILPNVAYVGGPAEIAYWLELKRTFDYYKINYPVLVLRNSAMLLASDTSGKMQKLGLAPKDFFLPADALEKKYVLDHDHTFSTEEEAKKIAAAFDALKKKIGEIDLTLIATVEGEKTRQLNSLVSLEEKAIRAAKKKHETAIQQIQKLKSKLFPADKLHERMENFLPYYIKYGDAFFDVLKDNFDPMATEVAILIEG